DDAIHPSEALHGVVRAGVVDERQSEPASDGQGQRLEDLGHDVFGRDEVDVVAADPLELEHHLGELCRAHLVAVAGLRGVVVLAEDALEVAEREEDGAAPGPAAEAVLLAEMGEVARDARAPAGGADLGPVRKAVHTAVARAYLAADKRADGLFGAALQIARGIRREVTRVGRAEHAARIPRPCRGCDMLVPCKPIRPSTSPRPASTSQR